MAGTQYEYETIPVAELQQGDQVVGGDDAIVTVAGVIADDGQLLVRFHGRSGAFSFDADESVTVIAQSR